MVRIIASGVDPINIAWPDTVPIPVRDTKLRISHTLAGRPFTDTRWVKQTEIAIEPNEIGGHDLWLEVHV